MGRKKSPYLLPTPAILDGEGGENRGEIEKDITSVSSYPANRYGTGIRQRQRSRQPIPRPNAARTLRARNLRKSVRPAEVTTGPRQTHCAPFYAAHGRRAGVDRGGCESAAPGAPQGRRDGVGIRIWPPADNSGSNPAGCSRSECQCWNGRTCSRRDLGHRYRLSVDVRGSARARSGVFRPPAGHQRGCGSVSGTRIKVVTNCFIWT